MVAKFSMHERNVNNLIHYSFLFISLLTTMVNNTKLQKVTHSNRMITNCVINFFMCKRKMSKFILYYFFMYLNVLLLFFFH